jgi:hypothetical protein
LEYQGQNESGSLGWEVVAFRYRIEDAVSIITAFDGKGIVREYENSSQFDTFGLMSGFYYKPKSKAWNIQINHTYMAPWQTKSNFVLLYPAIRVGDIASHRINLSITKQTDLGFLTNVLNLRANYVSARPIGPGTTQDYSIGLGDDSGEIPAYLLVNGNIAFKAKMIPFLRLDLSVENILNKNILDNNNPEYYHPGPENAAGKFNFPGDVSGTPYGNLNVPYFTQRPRFMTLKLSYSF